MAKKIKKSAKDSQREVYALLDSASAVLETLPDFVDGTLDLITKRSFAVSFSPLEYLFSLLQVIGVDEETIKKWLVDIFTVMLPPLETIVKAKLLTNLKGLIDCHFDPFIPEQYRKPYGEGYFTPRGIKNIIAGNMTDHGLIVNLNALDPDAMLSQSPLGEQGRELYFGQYHHNNDNVVESYDEEKNKFELIPTAGKVSTIPEVTVIGQRKVNPYEFVRAADFNAFLWLCIHKAKLPSPTVLEIKRNNSNKLYTNVGGCEYTVVSGSSLADYLVLEKTNSDDENTINIGATFTGLDNPNLLSIAIQVYPQVKIVPVSSDWNSCNWYVDRSRYFKENISSTITSERKYDKEFGVFNIKYMKPSDYECRIGNFEGNENILFSILPKPYVLTPTVAFNVNKNDSGDTTLNISVDGSFAKILFDGKGVADSNGVYTINPEKLNYRNRLHKVRVNSYSGGTVINPISGNGVGYLEFKLDTYPDSNNYDAMLYRDNKTYLLATITERNGTYYVETMQPSVAEKYLIECYPGLTLYEFNYDYVMGMRIFDPQVLTKRLINNIFNPQYNATFAFNFNSSNKSTRGSNSKTDSASYVDGKYKILNMVKKMIEEEDDLSDCFFSFTNEDYEEMLKKSAEARYHETPYRLWNKEGNPVDTSEIDRILGNYPVEGTLNEQREVISKAIEQAMITAEEQSAGGYTAYGGSSSTSNRRGSSASRVQFATDLFSQLTATIVDAVITPKLLLLLEINKQMVGEGKPSFTIDTLMDSVKGIVKSVVREILDMIMQKMLDYITSYVRKLISQLAAKYAQEQIMCYVAILTGLLSFFKKASKILSECQNRISSRFGENGYAYNQAITEAANAVNDFNFDLPTVNLNLNYFDTYVSDSNIEEPKVSDC